jgi:hypothetical protein
MLELTRSVFGSKNIIKPEETMIVSNKICTSPIGFLLTRGVERAVNIRNAINVDVNLIKYISMEDSGYSLTSKTIASNPNRATSNEIILIGSIKRSSACVFTV